MNKPTVSSVIAGCMKWGAWGAKLSATQYQQLIDTCLETGVTTFDHADIYGHYTTEEEFGKVLAVQPHLRQHMQIITKCGIKMVTPHRPDHLIKSYDTSKEHIIFSAENSLKNLNTDYIDILLIHRPDPLLHADEVAEAFTQLKQQGKVHHFGVSNFTVEQTALLLSRFPLCMNQVEISILHMDAFTNGVLDQCQQYGLLPAAWSPLGGGNLFSDSEDERNKRIIAVAEMLAQKYQHTPDQILLNWLMKHPSGIIPVTGTSKAERIRAAAQAASFTISREEWFLLWRASAGREVA